MFPFPYPDTIFRFALAVDRLPGADRQMVSRVLCVAEACTREGYDERIVSAVMWDQIDWYAVDHYLTTVARDPNWQEWPISRVFMWVLKAVAKPKGQNERLDWSAVSLSGMSCQLRRCWCVL